MPVDSGSEATASLQTAPPYVIILKISERMEMKAECPQEI
jgi:hypothetical protein